MWNPGEYAVYREQYYYFFTEVDTLYIMTPLSVYYEYIKIATRKTRVLVSVRFFEFDAPLAYGAAWSIVHIRHQQITHT